MFFCRDFEFAGKGKTGNMEVVSGLYLSVFKFNLIAIVLGIN